MAIALVTGQVASNLTASATSFTVVLPNNPTAGNIVVVGVRYAGTGTISVKDSIPNTYTATTKTPFSGVTARVGIFYLPNVPSGATKTLTVAVTGAAAAGEAWAAEFSGVATSSPLENDATANSGANNATITTPALLTTNADLVICTEGVGANITTANSPWTGIDIVRSGNYAAYLIQSVLGTATPNFTQDSSNSWSGITAAFSPPVAASGPFTPDDFPIPLGAVYPASLRSFTGGYSLELLNKDRQFGAAGQTKTYDYPNPLGIARPYQSDLRSWAASYNKNLIGKDKLPAGADVSELPPLGNDRPYQADLRTYAYTIPRAAQPLVGKAVLDLPASRPYQNDLRSFSNAVELDLLGQDTQFGAPGQTKVWDYPNPPGARPAYQNDLRSYVASLGYELTVPIGQDAMDLPLRRVYPLDLRVYAASLTYELPAQVPVRPDVLDLPSGRAYPLGLRGWAYQIPFPTPAVAQLPYGGIIFDLPPLVDPRQDNPHGSLETGLGPPFGPSPVLLFPVGESRREGQIFPQPYPVELRRWTGLSQNLGLIGPIPPPDVPPVVPPFVGGGGRAAGAVAILPRWDVMLVDSQGRVSREWFRWLRTTATQAQIGGGSGSGNPLGPVTIDASPFTFQASAPGSMIIAGGGIQNLEFSRDGVTWYLIGGFRGMYPLSPGDSLRVTWAIEVPVLTFVPR